MIRPPVDSELNRLPDWSGECVAVIAAGESAKTPDLIKLKGRVRVVAVNQSFQLCPWADMLYACDYNFWACHHHGTTHIPFRVVHDLGAKAIFKDLIRVDVHPEGNNLYMERFGYLSAGGNSGWQAMNLVAQMGARGIMMVGIDCTGSHWHGRHLPPMTNPDESNFLRWLDVFNKGKLAFDQLDIDVVNCSPISRVKVYPKMTIPEALERWGL